ncbi:hypothetical protein PBMFNG_PBMFNG_15745, partial [Dysosmobacter welbionis]
GWRPSGGCAAAWRSSLWRASPPMRSSPIRFCTIRSSFWESAPLPSWMNTCRSCWNSAASSVKAGWMHEWDERRLRQA